MPSGWKAAVAQKGRASVVSLALVLLLERLGYIYRHRAYPILAGRVGGYT